MAIVKRYFLKTFFLSLFLIIYPLPYCLGTVLTSDLLEHYPESGTYVAKGNVKIEKDDTIITANTLTFHQETSDIEAEGNIVFQDKDVSIITKKAIINLNSKTGDIYDAVIFFKKDNYWVVGNNISKTGENSYYAAQASFTTCNSEPFLTPEKFHIEYLKSSSTIESQRPDWCFKGKDVNIEIGKTLTAKNVTYRIKGVPLFYTPYLIAPILTERQTGFIMPILGTSSKKGFQFSPAFFWAIGDDKDLTIYLDYMSKRGLGKGVEFRYLDETGLGTWQAYHLRDRELTKDFVGIRIEDRFKLQKLTGFINVNYINNSDFYKEYGFNRQGKLSNLSGLAEINRFFQSSGEISLPIENTRLYLISQYWVDLQNNEREVTQKMPEFGYFVNPFKLGPFVFSFFSSFTNFQNRKEINGQRLLLNPVFSYSTGNILQVYHSMSFLQAIYNLSSDDTFKSFNHRETFQYNLNLLTRLNRLYKNFSHDVEISLGYRFMPKINPTPFFDYNDLLTKTSQLELSVHNILRANGLYASVRLTQPYDLNGTKEGYSFLPTIFEATLTSSPFSLKVEASYNFSKNNLEKFNSLLNLKVYDKTNIYTGERYDKTNDIKFFSLGIDRTFSEKFIMGANLSYDAKGGGLRESTVKAVYKTQCWAVNATFSRKPSDVTKSSEYNFSLIFELTGLGKFRTL
ncbi:MAG: hypothetical protein N3A59_07720 [Thermodesulfovibrionales bacterium]|nr:hypothetical protein [Thermodesulfovibrionales bacterium]